ncbi:hypothetical protein Droror1_Dr00026625, partial [Drosera rotundifolia]
MKRRGRESWASREAAATATVWSAMERRREEGGGSSGRRRRGEEERGAWPIWVEGDGRQKGEKGSKAAEPELHQISFSIFTATVDLLHSLSRGLGFLGASALQISESLDSKAASKEEEGMDLEEELVALGIVVLEERRWWRQRRREKGEEEDEEEEKGKDERNIL